MQKILFATIFSILLTSCATAPNKNLNSEKGPKEAIIGIWAMLPLRNGIANVVEFTKAGESNLHSFNCENTPPEEIELSTYVVSNNGKNINIKTNGKTQELSLIAIGEKSMILGQDVGGTLLQFHYIKANHIAPLCHLYKGQEHVQSKKTAFIESDFIQSPWIPENAFMARYVGAWADEQGNVQIEVKLDPNGKYKIFHENNENWNYLYNDVHWLKQELHFRSFAYSNKIDLFDHPYHKSSGQKILAPVDDLNKIKYSFFIDGNRYDYVLNKKSQ